MAIAGERRYAEFVKHAFLVVMLLFTFFPMYVMLNISFKTNKQFVNAPFAPTFPIHWENWATGWQMVHQYIFNTVTVAVMAAGFVLLLALPAAYFFGRFDVPFGKLLWGAMLFLMLMPGVANLIPLFLLLKNLNLLNTLWALILVGAAGGQVFCVFILKNFIADMPAALFEAAEIDGANHLQIIRHIVVPMCGSIIATLAILQFIGNWNQFILPMIIIRDDSLLTVAVGLRRLEGAYVKEWGPLMAGYTISSIPLVILFIFTLRLFVKGLATGAIKG